MTSTSLIELEEKVLELERYKRQEEQDRAKDLANRKRELLSARQQLQREIKKTHADVRLKTAEVEALENTVRSAVEQEERAIERQMRSNIGFQRNCQELEVRCTEKTELLQDRQAELGLARGRLAHLQLALRTLDEDLNLPTEFAASLEDILENVNADGAPQRPLKGPELTAALRREAAQLHDEEKRLECENDMLQEELKEVRRIFELGEQAFKVAPAPEPGTISRATTRATSGIASPATSKSRSAISPPGGLSSSSSTAKLYSTSPLLGTGVSEYWCNQGSTQPIVGSLVASVSAPAQDPLLSPVPTSSSAPSSRISYTAPTRLSKTPGDALRASVASYPSPLPVAPALSPYPMSGVVAKQPAPVQPLAWGGSERLFSELEGLRR